MHFPLKALSDSLQIPDGPSCLICSDKIGEIEGFIRLTAGAILYVNRERNTGGPSDKMDTVFSLWYHGPHSVTGTTADGCPIIDLNNTEFSMDVVEPLQGGQVDIHFCSTACLGSFFSSVVKHFDDGIKTAAKQAGSAPPATRSVSI
jgi:hypothetical protein